TVLATKVFGRMHDGPGGSGLSRKAILYQIHRFDPGTPAAETMEALHDVVKAGDVRVFPGWRRSRDIRDLPQILSVRGLRNAAEPLLQRLQQTGQVGGNGEVVQSGCGEEARVGDAGAAQCPADKVVAAPSWRGLVRFSG